jgi:hypothetical protein
MNEINKLRNQFAMEAMKALIEARSTLPEESDDSFYHVMECGINGQVNLTKEDGTKYAWGEIVAEEAYEMSDWMIKEMAKRGYYD